MMSDQEAEETPQSELQEEAQVEATEPDSAVEPEDNQQQVEEITANGATADEAPQDETQPEETEGEEETPPNPEEQIKVDGEKVTEEADESKENNEEVVENDDESKDEGDEMGQDGVNHEEGPEGEDPGQNETEEKPAETGDSEAARNEIAEPESAAPEMGAEEIAHPDSDNVPENEEQSAKKTEVQARVEEGKVSPEQRSSPFAENDDRTEESMQQVPFSGEEMTDERQNSAGSSRVESPRGPDVSPNALNLTWSFGVNKNVPAINLTDSKRKVVMYACASTAVLYNYHRNSQKLLQGHSNNISCICASQDRRWVATADKGPGSMIIVWDSFTGIPVQTIFDPHSDVGVAGITMSPDAKYIASLSDEAQQTFSIWDWTLNGESPLSATKLKEEYGLQTYITFNPEDYSQIVTNSGSQVIFYEWIENKLKYFAPELTDQDFNRMVGSFSQSIFCTSSTRALTATSVGNVVVWDNSRPISGPPITKPTPNKKAFKLVRLQERGITVLTTTDRYVVTGDVNGHVKFYDQQLTLLNWCSDFGVGPLNAVSFAYIPDFSPIASEDQDYPPDATITASSFVTRDYILSTSISQVAHITADGVRVKMIHDEHDASIHALTTHPTEPYIAIGSYSGLLKVWNYRTKTVLVSRKFQRGQMIRCIAYDPRGVYMGIGFTNGCVRILDSMTLEDECPEPFRYSRDAVTHCVFSHDSKWMATADADYCVTLYKAEHPSDEWPWTYLGKHRAHYKPIKTLTFGVALDSDVPRLLSLAEDRALVEYDLKNSEIDKLKLIDTERIEQSAVPQCMAWYPPVTKEQFYLTANDQFKFKLYNTTTTMCRKTLLAPTYGSPVQKMEIVPTNDPLRDKMYMAYITMDKIGLHILPLDGNPHNAMALIAHPSGVTNLVCSHDGKHVFTSGGLDATVLMWDINIIALEAAARLGGEDLIPFYGLLDGGREGELFKELENYFYYAQIRSQGVDTMDTRKVSEVIPVSEIPFVMRAMGHYPSEQEVEDMVNEVKFSQYVDSGKYVDTINLGDFIKLYVNHRPAFGLSVASIQEAFEVLGLDMDGTGVPSIDRGELLDFLQTKGEHMTESEVAEYITTLLGFNPEGGSSELGSYDAAGAVNIIEECLPEAISAELFTSEVLGFGAGAEAVEITSQE